MAPLTPSPKLAQPCPQHIFPERPQSMLVARYGVILEIPPHHRLQPLQGVRDGLVHALSQLRLDFFQLGRHALPDGLSLDHEEARLLARPTDVRLSRPAEFRHRPLAEPSVRLSPHSAPIRQTCRSYGLSVAPIEGLLLPVASVMRAPDPTPSLQPHYEPSSLLRVGPPQCSASVRSPRGFGRLGFSLNIRATGSCSSAQQPASASRPLDRKSVV